MGFIITLTVLQHQNIEACTKVNTHAHKSRKYAYYIHVGVNWSQTKLMSITWLRVKVVSLRLNRGNFRKCLLGSVSDWLSYSGVDGLHVIGGSFWQTSEVAKRSVHTFGVSEVTEIERYGR